MKKQIYNDFYNVYVNSEWVQTLDSEEYRNLTNKTVQQQMNKEVIICHP